MRILHFSDLHIGVENYGRIDPHTGLSTRLGDFLAALDQVVEFALSRPVDLVLLAGDAYKGRDPSQTHQREFAKRLARLSAAGIPAFLLVGNHDLPASATRANAVEIFSTLQVPQVYVGDRLTTYVVATPAGPLQVLAVPWPRRSVLLSRDETRGLSIEQVRLEVERRMTEAIQQQAQALPADIPAILTGHATVNGATVGTERSMMLGQDHILPISALQPPQVEYAALGHIHKHQVLRDSPGQAMVVYSGSLQRVDFSEEGDQKGFCVIELDPAAPQGHRLKDFQFHPVQARPFVTIDVRVPEAEADPTDYVLRAIARRDVTDAVVRVRVSLPAGAEAQFREQPVREVLKPAHYIAAVSREVAGERRTRLGAQVAQGLQPMQALDLYLQTRSVSPERREKMLRYARQLAEELGEPVEGLG
ncbi:MAG: exonuclease SbcCD subunit D [SAR202 cluster bacterium]|nr:exonuclease SbcCD subunit D [SAR202 cluster bacterium]